MLGDQIYILFMQDSVFRDPGGSLALYRHLVVEGNVKRWITGMSRLGACTSAISQQSKDAYPPSLAPTKRV